MATKHMFLIRYNLKSQAKSIEVESDHEVLTPEQARFYLESLHTSEIPAHITDVEVSKLAETSRGAPVGRQLQP